MGRIDNFRKLCDEHRELLDLRDALTDAIVRRDAVAVASMRWRICRVLLAHLATEDLLVYKPLLSRPGAEGVFARKLKDEMGNLGQQFRAFLSSWDIARIEREWPVFAAEAGALMDILGRRIQLEETRLYPMALRDGAAAA